MWNQSNQSKSRATKTVKQIKFKSFWAELEAGKLSPNIIIEQIFETNSCEIGHYWKTLISIFEKFLLLLKELYLWEEALVLAYNSMQFWDVCYFDNFL